MAKEIGGGWIHSFTVNETNKHKKGFTIYKITSIIFPRAIPEALTCISTWKRFHDVKRLYRELYKRHKAANLHSHVPEPKKENFFKRFDNEVIQSRRQYIIELLDYAAQYPILYKSSAFIQFFENGQTPPNQSPIHKKPHRTVQRSYSNVETINLKFSDNNFVESTKNEKGIEFKQAVGENKEYQNEENEDDVFEETENVIEKNNIVSEDNKNVTGCKTKRKELKKVILTPMNSIESDDYIYEAALEFSHAVQAEVNLDFKLAHKLYKNGVEILLNGSKDETNEERKFIARAKITKYMSRADEIYEKYILHCENQKQLSFQLSIDMTDDAETESPYLERPWNQLSRYKVMKIIGAQVLQVQDVTDKRIYIIKGIEKPSCNAKTQSIFLPQSVPYMVKLIAFFQSNQKIFLLLQHAKGGKLIDYIGDYSDASNDCVSLNDIFSEIEIKNDIPNCIENLIDSSENEKIVITRNEEHKIFNNSVSTDEYIPHFDVLSQDMDANDLVNCSQKLLNSVTKTLEKFKDNDSEVDESLNHFVTTNEDDSEIVVSKDNSKIFNECLEEEEIDIITNKTDGFMLSKKTEFNMSSENNFKRLPEPIIKQWSRELIIAIECLHSKGVILGDLKLENLLLGSKGQLLLSYFYQNEGDGYVDFLPLNNNSIKNIAPERPLTIKSDWWSFGIILFKLITGYLYQFCHPGGVFSYFELQFPPNVDISDAAKNLLEGLLQVESEKRFDLNDIKRHSFFSDTSWEDVMNNGLNSY